MRILVTGANGYLGQGIVSKLCDMGIEVVATDICGDNIDSRANTVTCDLFGVEDVKKVFGEIDVVLHLAWRDGFIHNSTRHIEDLPCHYSLLCKLIDAGAKKVCVMGTMHEIGFFEGSIDENTPCNPQNNYGIAKDALRKFVKHLCKTKGVDFQWLRGYYIVGNSKFGSSIFSKITAAESDGKELFPFTTGQNQYDFLDYIDFCKQVALAVSQDKVNGIINICSGKPEKLCDRVERFIKENNYKIKLEYGKFPDREYDSKAIWGNNKKIQEILNDAQLKI